MGTEVISILLPILRITAGPRETSHREWEHGAHIVVSYTNLLPFPQGTGVAVCRLRRKEESQSGH